MSFELTDQTVVVVTGASSGIGRAIALAFAVKRVRLVLIARNLEPLNEVAAGCRALGATALVQTIDIADPAGVDEALKQAVEQFGRIDVWVNCAAVLLFGPFEEIPEDVFNQVIHTNIIGYANGCRAALKQFRSQGNRGVIVDMSSMLGVVPEPYVSAYVATKFAVRGLTACLRQEHRRFPNIHICTVLPFAIDTPIYCKAGNYYGFEARSIVPVYSPERVARGVLRLAERPKREMRVGGLAHLLDLASRAAPGLTEALVGRFAPSLQFKSSAMGKTSGNLLESTGPYAVAGGWMEYWAERILPGRRTARK